MPNDQKMTITVSEAARILGKSAEALRYVIKKGAIPFALGWEGETGQWCFIIARPALMRWLEFGGKITKDGYEFINFSNAKVDTAILSDKDTFISVPEAAKILGKQAEVLRCAIKLGKIPFALGVEGKTGKWGFWVSRPALIHWIEYGGIHTNMDSQP